MWIPQLGAGAGAWLLLGPDDKVLRSDDLAELQTFSSREGQPPLAAAKNTKGQWGYLTTEGQWAMNPQWDLARAFTEDGLARVKINGLWGYVDLDFKVRIKPTWTEASPFSKGRAVVKMPNAMMGIIDTTGVLVAPARHRRIDNFAANGLARASEKEGRWGYVDRQGKAPFETVFDLALDFNDFEVAPAEVNDRWGVIDAQGRWVVKPRWSDLDEFQSPGLAAFRTAQYKTGYIDRQGREVIPAGELSRRIGQGLIRVGAGGSSHYSFIDTQGKPSIPGPFQWADDFGRMGPTTARLKGQWGLLSATGQWMPAGPDREPLESAPPQSRNTQKGLTQWLHAAQAIEWKNEQGQTVYRLTQKAVPSSKKGVLQLHVGDKLVWTSPPQTQTLGLMPFFEPRLQDVMRYDNAKLVDEARRMLAAKPRKFLPYSLVFQDRRDPYDLKELDDDEQEDIKLGAMTTLAETYVGEEEWGSYYFLSDQRQSLFETVAEQACGVLKAAFGTPQKSGKADPKQPWPLNSTPCAWQVGLKWLALVEHQDSGDGDFEFQVSLAVVAVDKK